MAHHRWVLDGLGRSLMSSVLCIAAASSALAEPWPDYGRTYPTPRYELDPNANFHYDFVVEKSFPPYQDPPMAEAVSLPGPLEDPAFDRFDVIVIVNKKDHPFWGAAQTLRAYQRGRGLLYYWWVSTGRRSYETPSGYFLAHGFSSRHWSNAFDAPMFWSVFFQGGKALHSSLDREALGDLGDRPSSHGCIHIEEYRAEALFHLIGRSGFGAMPPIDPRTGHPQLRHSTEPLYVPAPKTLIIIAPTGRFGMSPGTDAAAVSEDPPQPAEIDDSAPPSSGDEWPTQ